MEWLVGAGQRVGAHERYRPQDITHLDVRKLITQACLPELEHSDYNARGFAEGARSEDTWIPSGVHFRADPPRLRSMVAGGSIRLSTGPSFGLGTGAVD